MTAYMVRAGSGGNKIEEFIANSMVAIGFNTLGLKIPSSKSEISDYLRIQYEGVKEGTVTSAINQVNRFINDFKIGDNVVTYDPINRIYHIGEIKSEAIKSHKIDGLDVARSVAWQNTKSRDDVPIGYRNSLGAISTLFKIDEKIIKFLKDQNNKSTPEIKETSEDIDDEGFEDLEEKAKELIKDKILKLDFNEIPRLFAQILMAMGYKPTVSGIGPDRGVDIFASPDGLGLEEPRIKVEVKHRTETKIGAPLIRSFIGTLRSGDRGIYLSTGGFAKDAFYEADRSVIPVVLVDLDKLAELVVQNYDKFDSHGRALIQLVKIYWPNSADV